MNVQISDDGAGPARGKLTFDQRQRLLNELKSYIINMTDDECVMLTNALRTGSLTEVQQWMAD